MALLLRFVAWPFFIVMNIAICLLLLISAVLGTNYGTQQAVDAAQRWLPLEVASVEGNLLNELTIKGLQYQDESINATVESIAWSFNLAALWEQQRLVHLKNLVIENADITVHTAEAPAETEDSSEPFTPQDIELPVSVKIDAIELRNIRLQQGETTYQVEHLVLNAEVDKRGNSLAGLTLENGPFNSHAQLEIAAGMTQQGLTADLQLHNVKALLNEQNLNAQGALALSYNSKSIAIDAQQLIANYGSIRLEANGSLSENNNLSLNINAPDLGLATDELGGSMTLNGVIKNADRIDLNATLNNVTWLNEPQLSNANIHWQGTLAKQEISADFSTPLLNNQALTLNSQFGWRDSFETLLAALSLPPETLLKQPALHFKAEALLPQTQIAASGVELSNNRIGITLSEQGQIALSGHSESGIGAVDLSGFLTILNSAEQDIALNADVSGEQYQLANTPELKLSVSPAINAKLAEQLLTVRGQVTVDGGHIELIVPEEGAVTASSDVVVLEEGQSQAEAESSALARDINIKLVIAEPITLEGQGFEGNASGQLTVTEQSGKPPRARGELLLAGQYQAYGQDLTIRRGKLIYVDSPIDDPGVDLEAIRTVDEQVAGVRVTGLASSPKIEIFAEPALSETEALSYLVLGRGLDDSSEQDQVQLRSLALSLGLAKSGKFLEKSKEKLGVDELSIQTGDSNNEASLLVGRQLSKRLYLSTQIGLFEPVTKLFLRYQLSRKCEAVAETGTQQGADVVCTLATD